MEKGGGGGGHIKIHLFLRSGGGLGGGGTYKNECFSLAESQRDKSAAIIL